MKKRQKKVAIPDKQFYVPLECLSTGVLVHDPDMKIRFSNSAAQDLLGMSGEQMQGRLPTELSWVWIREDRTKMLPEEYPANQVLHSGKPLQNQVIGLSKQEQNTQIWVECRAYPDFDKHGKLFQVIVILTNITQKKNFLSSIFFLRLP